MKFLKTMLGGWAWVPIAVLLVTLGGLVFEFNRRGDRIEELKTDNARLENENLQGVNNQGALSERDERKDAATELRGQAHAKIDQAQNSTQCANSEPIGVTLGLLSDRAAERADNP